MYDDVKIYRLMIVDPDLLKQQKSCSSCLVGHAVGFVFDIVHENVTVSCELSVGRYRVARSYLDEDYCLQNQILR